MGKKNTSEFKELSIGWADDEHVRRFIARRHRCTNQRKRTSGLLTPPLLIHEILQLTQLRVQHEIPAHTHTHYSIQFKLIQILYIADLSLADVSGLSELDQWFCLITKHQHWSNTTNTFYYSLLQNTHARTLIIHLHSQEILREIEELWQTEFIFCIKTEACFTSELNSLPYKPSWIINWNTGQSFCKSSNLNAWV